MNTLSFYAFTLYLSERPEAGIFKQSMGANNRVGIGLLYRPARLHRLAELILWNRFLCSLKVLSIGFRERWSLGLLKLTQMWTLGVHVKGVLPWWVPWVRRAGTTDFFPALSALVIPEQNIFSSPLTFSLPIAPQPGQAVMQGHLSLVSLFSAGITCYGRREAPGAEP